MTNKFKNMYKLLMRRKPMEDSTETRLAKVLTTFDLTALSIGSTLGVGVYVLAGELSKSLAGPATIISFLIAAIASIFAGLCYAEFGTRVPKAGSAYVYSYVTIGEFVAFIIGWNLIMEYAIGSASVVKAMGKYLDSLMNKSMSTYMRANFPMNVAGFGQYPDIFAFGVTLLFSWAIALGAKESSILNSIFTLVNLSVVLFVIVIGLFKVQASNWSIPKDQVPDEKYGDGGFMPYGVTGILKGAATAFYGFIGFDCIATAGEEAKNPKKSIPIAVVVSLSIIFLAYFGISSVLTLILPYYDQDEESPLPHIFKHLGWKIPQYIVSVGAICALCTSLMGAMFPLPRIVFAMASDGLLFKFIGEISEKYRTPFNGTLVTGVLTAILAAIFDLGQLIDMMAIGTLLAYSMVAGCVLILRYEYDDRMKFNGRTLSDDSNSDEYLNKSFFNCLFNLKRSIVPNKFSSNVVTYGISLYSVFCIMFSMVLIKFEENYLATSYIDTVLLICSTIPLIAILYMISCQPGSGAKLSFKVPLVPWLPGISILINIYLMMRLNSMTWVRFGIWLIVGFVIYFTYSIRNSKEKQRIERRENINNAEVAIEQETRDTPLVCMLNNPIY